LTPKAIVTALRADHGIRVSKWVVRQLLKKHGYRRRQAQKKWVQSSLSPWHLLGK